MMKIKQKLRLHSFGMAKEELPRRMTSIISNKGRREWNRQYTCTNLNSNKQIQAMRINHLLSEILFRHFLHYLRWITTESVVPAHDVPNIQTSDMLEMKRFMNLPQGCKIWCNTKYMVRRKFSSAMFSNAFSKVTLEIANFWSQGHWNHSYLNNYSHIDNRQFNVTNNVSMNIENALHF